MAGKQEFQELDRLIGKRVRQERLQRGFTLEEMSDACSISISYLGQVELGKTPVSLTTVKKIVTALDIPLDEFFSSARPADSHKNQGMQEFLNLAPLLKRHTPKHRKIIVDHWKGELKLFSRLSKKPRS